MLVAKSRSDHQLLALIGSLDARLGNADARVAGLDRVAERLSRPVTGRPPPWLSKRAASTNGSVKSSIASARLIDLPGRSRPCQTPADIGLERFEVAEQEA